MEKEVPEFKFQIKDAFNNLCFLKELRNLSKEVVLYGDLEIEPFTELSLAFQAEYWYIKYHLLEDKKVDLNNEFISFFDETDINIIWLYATDKKTFNLECKDGKWYIGFYSMNNKISNFFQKEFHLTFYGE